MRLKDVVMRDDHKAMVLAKLAALEPRLQDLCRRPVELILDCRATMDTQCLLCTQQQSLQEFFGAYVPEVTTARLGEYYKIKYEGEWRLWAMTGREGDPQTVKDAAWLRQQGFTFVDGMGWSLMFTYTDEERAARFG